MTAAAKTLSQLSAPGLKKFVAALGRAPFRGTMIDNCSGAPMGKGHKNDGQPFDIETACYLKPIVEAYHRPGVRKIVIKSGVKTLKSFFVELAAAHYLCHLVGDVTIYFGTGEMADDQSTTRILNYFEGIESYKEKLKTIIGQWDFTMSAVKFPDKTFRIKPANLGNTQGVNLGFVGVCDAFVTEATGMIDQAIERTTQYADDKKIVLESQGGEKGFDFDRHYDDTDQGELHVICPICHSPHIFNWKAFDPEYMTRPEDFVLIPPLVIPSLDHAAWITHHRPLLMSAARRVAGFKRGPDELIKFDSGDYNEAAILRETHFECYHCGGIWRDDGEFGPTRIALDRSSHYIPARADALPENVGFNIPQWINRRLPWGKIMLENLKRHKVNKELGNIEPLKQWWQKFAGRTWDPEMLNRRQKIELIPGSYETNPENLSYGAATMRQMTVDTGKSPESETNVIQIGQLFFEARDFDNGAESFSRGASRQITRGMVQDCIMDTPDGRRRVSCWELLAAQQHYWHITNRHVLIDIRYAPSQVIEAAVKFHEIVDLNGKLVARENYGKQVDWPSCWRFCEGSAHANIGPQKKPFFIAGLPRQSTHDKSGRVRNIVPEKIMWSNYAFEDQFERIVMLKTAAVGWDILAQDKLVIVGLDGKPNAELTRKYIEFEQDKEGIGQFRSWVSGLNSRTLDDKKRKYIDNAKQAYAKGHWTEPRDCSLMQLVGAAAEGMLGHVAVDGGETSNIEH